MSEENRDERERAPVIVEARAGDEIRPPDPEWGSRCTRYSSARCGCWACEDDRFGGPDE